MKLKTLQVHPKVILDKISPNASKFTIGPLLPGLGTTISNALRRTSFRFEEGYAISNVKFRPVVAHEFAAIEGVSDDIQTIILNLKEIRFKKNSEQAEDKILVLLKGVKQFTGKDIANAASSFEVLNPNFVICHMDESVNLEVELTITKGRGYVPSVEHAQKDSEIGSFPIDAIYSPIVNVKVDIGHMLFEERTDYEKIDLEIQTNGAIEPKLVLKNAADFLRNIFAVIADEEIAQSLEENKEAAAVKSNMARINQLLDTPLEDLKRDRKLSARVVNSLVGHGFVCIKDIMNLSLDQILQEVVSFGKKSKNDLEVFIKKVWKDLYGEGQGAMDMHNNQGRTFREEEPSAMDGDRAIATFSKGELAKIAQSAKVIYNKLSPDLLSLASWHWALAGMGSEIVSPEYVTKALSKKFKDCPIRDAFPAENLVSHRRDWFLQHEQEIQSQKDELSASGWSKAMLDVVKNKVVKMLVQANGLEISSDNNSSYKLYVVSKGKCDIDFTLWGIEICEHRIEKVVNQPLTMDTATAQAKYEGDDVHVMYIPLTGIKPIHKEFVLKMLDI